MKTLGFIGFGEAAYHITRGLKKEGWKEIYAYDAVINNAGVPQSLIYLVKDRADSAGVTLLDSAKDVVCKSQIVIVSVPAGEALNVARTIETYLSEGQIYVDVTTASPTDKRRIEEVFSRKNILFVDGAMMGPLRIYDHKVPIFASGNGATKWKELMSPYNMAITVVQGNAGKATRIKYIRSIFMKGIEALLLETFLAARKSGVVDEVLSSLTETMNKTDFKSTVNRLITGDAIHAERRYHELKQSAKLLETLGIEPFVTEGSCKRLKWSYSLGIKDAFEGKVPESIEEVFEMWEKKGVI